MAKSNEPIWWSLFSAGGVVAAMFVPVLVVITGIVLPLGLAEDAVFDFDRVRNAVSQPLIKLILLMLIALPFFHWAHRFRFTLVDLGLRSLRQPIAILCYGSAILGSIVTAVVLWRL